eukprot:maker-scaffold459_size165548-snap-gene-0.20 protein:Tk05714 transcript:maker-scaffold459_size165548-snap-gene-0.20-mRNA-1 annotation:"unknown"
MSVRGVISKVHLGRLTCLSSSLVAQNSPFFARIPRSSPASSWDSGAFLQPRPLSGPMVRPLSVGWPRWQEDKKKEPSVERPEYFDFKSRNLRKIGEGGPVSWKNLAVTGGLLMVCLGFYLYARSIKDAEREVERKRQIGKAKIGGGFQLIDQDGNPKTDKDFHGKWVLLYFGFTHCPDICPDEMEKMSAVYDNLVEEEKKRKRGLEFVPLFITVDPDRDQVKQIKEYIAEFHPDMIGLTGTTEKIMEAGRAYRVYFSAGPKDEDNDYIVDHTIIIYLINPKGDFVDYYGQTKNVDQVTNSIKFHIEEFVRAEKTFGLF